MKSTIYITYSETHVRTERTDENRKTVYTTTVGDATLNVPKNPYHWSDTIEHTYPLKKVYAVVSTITESDTFSSSAGRKKLEGCFTSYGLAENAVAHAKDRYGWGVSVDDVEILLLDINPDWLENLDIP